jgi:hypothetical protein
VRIFDRTTSGDLYPTPHGIALGVAELPTLAAAMQNLLRAVEARNNGADAAESAREAA